MSKEENVLNFYVLCNKLKNVIRTGWKNWNVGNGKERIESVIAKRGNRHKYNWEGKENGNN